MAALKFLLGHPQIIDRENILNLEFSRVTEMNEPLLMSQPVMTLSLTVIQKGYEYKMFMACKILTYSCNLDLVKTMWWLIEMDINFYINKCLNRERVIFALIVLKLEALFRWDIMRFLKGVTMAKSMC